MIGNRWSTALITFVVITLAAFGLVWLVKPVNRIHHRSYRLIQFGMTQADVDAVLGSPPGMNKMRAGKFYVAFPMETGGADFRQLGTPLTWGVDKTEILVWFDEHGRVRAKQLNLSRNYDWFERVIDWLDPPRVNFEFDGP